MEIIPLQYALGIFTVPCISYFLIFAAVVSALILLFR